MIVLPMFACRSGVAKVKYLWRGNKLIQGFPIAMILRQSWPSLRGRQPLGRRPSLCGKFGRHEESRQSAVALVFSLRSTP
jgi:hypothetical protein